MYKNTSRFKEDGQVMEMSNEEFKNFKKEVLALIEQSKAISKKYKQYINISSYSNGDGHQYCLDRFKEVAKWK